MGIEWEVLGQPGADNALLVSVDSGQSIDRLLFDCGEGCLAEVRPSVVQSVDHLLFSHFHMDHVAGFDSFFRRNYNRPDVAVNVWGPPQTIEVMAHRFRSFTWNLHRGQPGEWVVHEISRDRLRGARFLLDEAFAETGHLPDQPRDSDTVFRSPHFRVEAKLLPHGSIESVAYRVVEAERRNVNPAALQASGLPPGAWLQELSEEGRPDAETVSVAGRDRRLGDLRAQLMETAPGRSLARLTDFRLEPDSPAWEEVRAWLEGTSILVSECHFGAADAPLARNHGHMTADLVGRLAREAGAGKLVLHHLSRRYEAGSWLELREEARREFPAADFPPTWRLGR